VPVGHDRLRMRSVRQRDLPLTSSASRRIVAADAWGRPGRVAARSQADKNQGGRRIGGNRDDQSAMSARCRVCMATPD
jgi:hypothetical protein